MNTFYCSHPFAETWFDWLANVRFCTTCGCAESKSGARFTVSVEFVALRRLCVDSNQGRGVWKVIDEQRALLQHLQSAAPQVLSQCPWIEGWLARTDMFLVNMARLLGLPDRMPHAGMLPRPWPGNYELDYLDKGAPAPCIEPLKFCLRPKTCDGCTALTAFARREVIWPVGMENPSASDQELLQRGLLGKCDLGFPQKWHDWGFATPLEPCPKPTITSKQAGEMYSLISGKTKTRNAWHFINDIRGIIDILKNFSPEVLEVTFIEEQLAGVDAVLRKAINVMHISQPEGFELKKWNASIGPCHIDE